jgi:hypothetical protein
MGVLESAEMVDYLLDRRVANAVFLGERVNLSERVEIATNRRVPAGTRFCRSAGAGRTPCRGPWGAMSSDRREND